VDKALPLAVEARLDEQAGRCAREATEQFD
jgi:hypothetical protein